MTNLPTFHLNGTSPDVIYHEYRQAYKSLVKAVKDLEDATCNPRDFYVQGEGAWERAQNERAAMFAKLKEVQDYVLSWVDCSYDHRTY